MLEWLWLLQLIPAGVGVYFLFCSIRFALSSSSPFHLNDIRSRTADKLPPVSILVPACNEESEIEAGLRSLMSLDYPDYEVIVVNDRSTDRTGLILDKLVSSYPEKLSRVHLQELPEGWLGKTHALYTAFQKAKHDLILFTDADTRYEATALKRAVTVLLENRADVLSVSPVITSQSSLLRAMMISSWAFMCLFLRLDQVHSKNNFRPVGVGAFNLVTRRALNLFGYFKKVQMEVVDDLAVGFHARAAGLKQLFAYGDGEIEIPWYSSVQAFVLGLEKNIFAMANFNYARGALTLSLLLGFALLPLLCFVPFPNAGSFWSLGILLLGLMSFSKACRYFGRSWQVLLFPINLLVIAWSYARTLYLTKKQGGVYWRRSFYSLDSLRKGISFKR